MRQNLFTFWSLRSNLASSWRPWRRCWGPQVVLRQQFGERFEKFATIQRSAEGAWGHNALIESIGGKVGSNQSATVQQTLNHPPTHLSNVIKTTNCPCCTEYTQLIYFIYIIQRELFLIYSSQRFWNFDSLPPPLKKWRLPHNKMTLLVNCEFIMKLISVEVKYQLTILFEWGRSLPSSFFFIWNVESW